MVDLLTSQGEAAARTGCAPRGHGLHYRSRQGAQCRQPLLTPLHLSVGALHHPAGRPPSRLCSQLDQMIANASTGDHDWTALRLTRKLCFQASQRQNDLVGARHRCVR